MRSLRKYETLDDPADDWAYLAPARTRRRSGAGKALLGIFVLLLLIASATLLYIRQYTVTGVSMQPTLMAGDRVFYVGFTEAKYGDLVIFDAGDLYGLVIKRVAGLPGDRVEVTADGHLLRNGEAVDEGYLLSDSLGNSAMAQTTVESGRLFVLGDNRAASIDSRDVRVGQITFSSIRGIVTRMLRDTQPSQ
jgi:signal peptidase I